jgi:hypothetical protein
VINTALPRALFPKKDKKIKAKAKNQSACLFPKIEFCHDETARRKLLTIVWSRYRINHPGMLPWDLGQHMLDVNPLLDDHVLFTKCHGAF